MKLSISLVSLLAACTLAVPSRVQVQPDVARRQEPSPTATACVYADRIAPTSICGSGGSLSRPDPLGVAKIAGTRQDCARRCYATSGCKSFYFEIQYQANYGTCQLYRASIKRMGLKHATKNKAAYYDKACYAKTCSCGNEGAQFAVFNSTAEGGDVHYPNFDPTVFKTETPLFQDLTSYFSFGYSDDPGSDINIYQSNQTFSPYHFAINHRGYLYALATSNYTISIPYADDIALVWVGPNAYSGYTRANANLEMDVDSPPAQYTFAMTAGEYVPVRLIYGQYISSSNLFALVVDHNGNPYALDSDFNPLFVQYSCDGTTAPPYPDFGSET